MRVQAKTAKNAAVLLRCNRFFESWALVIPIGEGAGRNLLLEAGPGFGAKPTPWLEAKDVETEAIP